MLESTGLEIGMDFIRLVQLRKIGKEVELSGVAEISFAAADSANYDKKAVTEALKKLLVDARFKSNNIIAGISRHLVTIKNLSLPSRKYEELQGMVGYEVKGMLPYPLEKLVYDFTVMEGSKEGYSDVLVALVQKEIIDEYFSLLTEAGIKVNRIDLTSLARLAYYLRLRKAGAAGETEEKVAFVNVEKEKVEVDVVEKGRIFYSRGIDLQRRNAMVEKGALVEEIIRSLSSAEKGKEKIRPGRIIISGGYYREEGLEKILAERLGIKVEDAEPFREMKISTDITRAEMTERGPRFTTAIGLALQGFAARGGVNLLPIPVKKKIELEKRKGILLKQGVSAAMVLVLISANCYLAIGTKQKRLYSMKKTLDKIRPVASQVETKRGELKIIREELGSTDFTLQALVVLHQLTPDSVSLNAFHLEKGGSVLLRGQGDNMSIVFGYCESLRRSPLFKEARVRYLGKRKLEDKRIVDFEIYCVPAKKGIGSADQ